MKTIEEIFGNRDLVDIFDSYGCGDDDFELVHEEMEGYDEGTVYTRIIVRFKEENRLFAATNASNSWADYYDDIELEDIKEVAPKEVTITQYVEI